MKCSALTICHHGGLKLPQKIAFPRPAVLTALSSNHETRPQRAPSKKIERHPVLMSNPDVISCPGSVINRSFEMF